MDRPKNEGPMRREMRTHGGVMVSEEVRPRMTGKGTNQETVTRKKRTLSTKEKQKGDPWEMGGQ